MFATRQSYGKQIEYQSSKIPQIDLISGLSCVYSYNVDGVHLTVNQICFWHTGPGFESHIVPDSWIHLDILLTVNE